MSGNTKAQKTHAGEYFVGPYRIERPLGFELLEGVYLARHTVKNKEVELRIFRISEAAEKVRAPGALNRLIHPGIASIHSAERIDDHLVVAMDYVEGATLRDILREKGRLDPSESVRILSTVASALEYIHNLSAEGAPASAHLDIKPSNIIVGEDGSAKIIDFRLAQLVAAGAPHIDRILRSPAYLAPEQLQGGASPQSDLWAAGVLFFEMLMGRAPRPRESLESKVFSLRELDAEEGPDFANLPEPCRRIILRCLQPLPAHRFTSAHELAVALAAAGPASGLPSCPTCGTLMPHGVSAAPEPAFNEIRAVLEEGTRRLELPYGRRMTRLLLLGAAVMLLVAGLTFGTFWLRTSPWNDQGAARPVAEMQSFADTAKETGQSQPAGEITENLQASPRSVPATDGGSAGLPDSGAPAGAYAVRLAQLTRLVRRNPGTSEAARASGMIRALERESLDFSAAEDLELKQDSTICEKLARWQEFLDRQTTGLRRDYAMSRVQYWTQRVENYVGYASLTVRSVTGLPAKDTGFLDSGQPDPYLVLLDGNQVLYRSPTVDNSSSPPWYKENRIYIWNGMKLSLEIWDDNILGNKRLISQALDPLPVDGLFQVSSGGIAVDLEIRRER